jgi:hypothetical protein
MELKKFSKKPYRVNAISSIMLIVNMSTLSDQSIPYSQQPPCQITVLGYFSRHSSANDLQTFAYCTM